MHELIIAAITIIFYTIFMPMLDAFAAFIQNFFNRQIRLWQLELDDLECAIHDCDNREATNTQAIGFEIPEEIIEEEVEENNNKRRK